MDNQIVPGMPGRSGRSSIKITTGWKWVLLSKLNYVIKSGPGLKDRLAGILNSDECSDFYWYVGTWKRLVRNQRYYTEKNILCIWRISFTTVFKTLSWVRKWKLKRDEKNCSKIETWMYDYDPEAKQWMTPTSSRSKGTRQVRSKKFVPAGQTVLFDVLSWSRKSMKLKRPEMCLSLPTRQTLHHPTFFCYKSKRPNFNRFPALFSIIEIAV